LKPVRARSWESGQTGGRPVKNGRISVDLWPRQRPNLYKQEGKADGPAPVFDFFVADHDHRK
ncbi:MAG: hypothetical protein QGG36_09865, partial [Pirellulaceae bacterium]|nr:hypothetical protein [Pirellulaceae bacterium]